ncbi:hypothetical protein [Scytonema sp. NUACC26]|uniref:hypothetical protein n=1 Tax=Scytonema sp. NUACC26 TaxID=3140176 RepID=UPI0038B30F88
MYLPIRSALSVREAQAVLGLSSFIAELPPKFGQLTNLQSLHLRYNQLRALPPEFGQLTNL